MSLKILLIRFFPISSLAICLQAYFALTDPISEIGSAFIAQAYDLFVVELVFMHSTIFWYGFDSIAKAKWQKFLLKLILALGYLFFIFPIAQKNPWIGFSYILFSTLRLLEVEQQHWLQKTDFVSKYTTAKDQKIILSTYSLLKAFYFALVLTLLSHFVPASADLNLTLVKNLVAGGTDPGFVIVSVKTLFLYFLFLFLFELGLIFRTSAGVASRS